MGYNIGDKVIIKEDLKFKTYDVVPSMTQYCNKIAKIINKQYNSFNKEFAYQLEIEGIECELNSSDNFNLTASISTSNVQVSVTDVTVENDEEDPSKFKNEISAYYVDKSSTDVYNDITIIQTNSLTEKKMITDENYIVING